MKDQVRVLFLCVHNTARSQMAEAYFNHMSPEGYIAESAGYEPGTLNPFVVKVMAEDGIDISNNKVDNVFDFYKEGKLYNYAVTVCDQANHQKCPIFPGMSSIINWDLEDPSQLSGFEDDVLKKVRLIRDKVKENVRSFINSMD